MRYITLVTAPCLSTSAVTMMPLICAADLGSTVQQPPRYVTPVTALCFPTSAMTMMPLICAADPGSTVQQPPRYVTRTGGKQC